MSEEFVSVAQVLRKIETQRKNMSEQELVNALNEVNSQRRERIRQRCQEAFAHEKRYTEEELRAEPLDLWCNRKPGPVEIDPKAFFTTGFYFKPLRGHSISWVRAGRLRLGWYRGRILRTIWENSPKGWQVTLGKAFLSWTKRP